MKATEPPALVHADRESVAPPSSRSGVPRERVGASPGTLRIEDETRPQIFLMDYSETHLQERELTDIEECLPFLEKDSIAWIDVRGIGHAPTYERLGEIFHIHPLALEDMVNVPQRAKSDVYPDQQLLVTKMVTVFHGHIFTEQLSILFGKGFVVTVQEERAVDCLDPLRERIRGGRGMLRKSGSDYLAYAIFDTVIDGYFPVLEHFGELLDATEIRALSPKPATSAEIFALKRELLQLRKAIWPQRDLLASLLRDETPHVRPETRVYFRDTYDHSVQIMDMVEGFREIASSLMELLMTSASNRMNEVMKVLTVLSTVFLPMTFIAGVYGMNFDTRAATNMPELGWKYGYVFSLGIMVASAASLLLYYRSRGFIGTKGDTYERVSRSLLSARRQAFGAAAKAKSRKKPAPG